MSRLTEQLASGSLVGTWVGDGLGGRVEGLDPTRMRDRYRTPATLSGLTPVSYGAATEMSVAVAVSLAKFPDFNGADLACRLVAGCTPFRGYGKGTLAAIERLHRGVDWREAGVTPAGRTSFGNGGAIRAGPVGLVYHEDAEALRWVAEEQAAITHGHALACEGAVLQAYAVALAVVTVGKSIDGMGFLLEVGAQAQLREFRSRYEVAARLVERESSEARVVSSLGNGTSALGSVVTAAYCFARHPDDFGASVHTALSMGGNTRSIASMTAAISGAHLGLDAIPRVWRDGVEGGEIAPALLSDLGRQLVRLSLTRG